MNPKFAILRKLEYIEVEHDTGICLAKLRYEISRIEALQRQIEIEETEYGRCEERKRRKLENDLTEEERKEELIKSAKSRQTFDPQTKRFDYSKRMVTDLEENCSVNLPKEVHDRYENQLGVLKEIVIKEYKKYKEELEREEKNGGVAKEKLVNQQGANLTQREKKGLKKLKFPGQIRL